MLLNEVDLERMRIEIERINAGLWEFKQATSIDVLGTSTRGYLDRLLLTSLIGIAISTATRVTLDEFGGVQLELGTAWFLPASLAVVILYYVFSLLLLVQSDYRRWDATYALKIEKPIGVLRQMNNLSMEWAEVLKSEFDNAPDDLEIHQNISARVKQNHDFAVAIGKAIEQAGHPTKKARRGMKSQIFLFVVVPVALGFLSAGLLIRSCLVLTQAISQLEISP